MKDMLRTSLLALRKNPRRNHLRFYCMVTATGLGAKAMFGRRGSTALPEWGGGGGFRVSGFGLGGRAVPTPTLSAAWYGHALRVIFICMN